MSSLQNCLADIAATCPAPLPEPQAGHCESHLNIGFFFDGTDNNKEHYPFKDTNTNVVRLWETYIDEPDNGYFRYYVSGVGTPFTELERKKSESMGSPFGAGGASRIHYGLMQIINSVHKFLCNQTPLYSINDMDALCSSIRIPQSTEHGETYLNSKQKILQKLGLSQGLDSLSQREKNKFFQQLEDQISALAKTEKPKIVGIYIDVFGFSRGAAQARVFTSWLHQYWLKDGKMFGIPCYVRILGIFDTVASVGPTAALGSDGHHSWATAENLRINPAVKNCYHIVALHELRMNFPLDSVTLPDGSLPSNCQEVFMPGAHSDVGGGYGEGEQGKIVLADSPSPIKDDRYRLSCLPLNRMLEAAQKSCEGHTSSPWLDFDSKTARSRDLDKRFSLDQLEIVHSAVENYFGNSCTPALCSTIDEALRAHGLRYLAWRYAVARKKGFEHLQSVQYARALTQTSLASKDKKSKSSEERDLKYYLEGNKIFNKQIAWLSQPSSNDPNEPRRPYHSRARDIFEDMKNTAIDPSMGDFFDTWVHDSFAGFIEKFEGAGILSKFVHNIAEKQGYVRWRGLYSGSDNNALALNTVDQFGQEISVTA